MSGKVQMFLAEGCFHQFHIDCFKVYAKKTLLTKHPSGDFAQCRCKRCNTLVQAEDLREALGPEALQKIREQQAEDALQIDGNIVTCPNCNERYSFQPS